MAFSDQELIDYIGEDNLKLSNLMSAEEKQILQELLGGMSAEMGVATTLSDPDGTPVLNYINFSDLCLQIRSSPEGLKRCKYEAFSHGEMSKTGNKPQVYTCHAGIMDFIAPITMFNRRIGNIAGGQFLIERPGRRTREQFREYFEEIGLENKEEALRALNFQRINEPDKIRKLANVYMFIGKFLSNYFRLRAQFQYGEQLLLHLNEKLDLRVKERTAELEKAVHELKLAQMGLVQQEKLTAIGRLVSGIANEISHPMGLVMQDVEKLDHQLSKCDNLLDIYREFREAVLRGEDNAQIAIRGKQIEQVEAQIGYIKGKATAYINEAKASLEGMSNIVQAFRQFGRDDQSHKIEWYDVKASLENVLLITKNEHKSHAKFEKRYGDTPLIQAVGSEINQVLLNLIVNAVQAVKDKFSGGEGLIILTTYCDDDSVGFSIEDNGVGIPQEYMGKLFEPFLRTRTAGRGSGLGLSISYDIVVNKHGGKLTVDSTEGIGTKVTMKLPITHRSV